MKLPLEITFRNMQPSDAVEQAVFERVSKLDKFNDQILACKATIIAPHKHHHKGNLFQVKIEVKVPRGELIVSHTADEDHTHEDVYVAVRDAFDAMRRQLENHARRRRRQVKTHQTPSHGRVAALLPDENYGMIFTADGRELYFHRNSVLNADFEELQLDTEVRFSEALGDLGPRASAVTVIGKHHIIA